MDPLVQRLVDWIEIPSVTGDEGDYGDAVVRRLAEVGFDVERQEVAPGRFNVLARAGDPDVVFCTHLDTVPPYFGSKLEPGLVRGRGACDAKGQAVAMIAAAERLLAEGEDAIGFLLTVGEEVDSAGAAWANERIERPPRFTIVGEPTGGRFVAAGKGLFKGRLLATGVAGHSSEPKGPSAIHALVGCMHHLLEGSWGEHPLLGPGSVNFGEIEGGVAANVVADRAEASILARTVEPVEDVRARIQRALGPSVTLQQEAKAYPPIEFLVPDESAPEELCESDPPTVSFGTDAPHLGRWGQPLLCGPGSIRDAHTDHEKIELRELEDAVERYVRCVRWLRAR